MRYSAALFCCVALAASAAQTPQPQQPVFRGGVELVTLDVTVVDKNGKPIKGLKPEDFVVTLDGQTRTVRVLDFLEFGSSAGSEAAPTRQATNQQTSTPVNRGGRVFLIVFDDLSCRPMQAKGLTVAAERMLATLDLNDLVGLVTTSGLGPVVQPTRDRAVLRAALKSKTLIGRYDDNPSPRFYIGVHEALDIYRGNQSVLARVIERACGIKNYDPRNQGDASICPNLVEADGRHLGALTMHRAAMQMASFRALIEAMKAAPKPRIMVALSSGVAASVEFDLKEQTDSISRAAVEAGVQFYALTEAGPDFDMMAIGGEMERREESAFLHSGVQTVATAAGGEAFLVIGTADRFFTRIEHETSGFYRLGVEAPILPDKRRFLNAKVTVRSPGVTVRTNPRAMLDSAPAETVPIEDRLRTALAQGGGSLGVPIALATALRREPASGQLQLGVNVQVPSTIAGPLVAMFSVVNETGQVVQAGRKDVPVPSTGEDYRLGLPVPIAPGKYRLRFAVADAAGRVGSVEHRFIAGLPHLSACAVSELLVSWSGADGASKFLALETLPELATTLGVALEVYPDDPAAPPDVTVTLALLRTGEETPAVQREITPSRSGTILFVNAHLPVESLTPGSYVIRATIREAGRVTGTVTAAIRR